MFEDLAFIDEFHICALNHDGRLLVASVKHHGFIFKSNRAFSGCISCDCRNQPVLNFEFRPLPFGTGRKLNELLGPSTLERMALMAQVSTCLENLNLPRQGHCQMVKDLV